MGHGASFPLAWYCTEMCREYMSVLSFKLPNSLRALKLLFPYGETVIPMVHHLFGRFGRFQYQQSADR